MSCRAAAQGVSSGRGHRAVMCHPMGPTQKSSRDTISHHAKKLYIRRHTKHILRHKCQSPTVTLGKYICIAMNSTQLLSLLSFLCYYAWLNAFMEEGGGAGESTCTFVSPGLALTNCGKLAKEEEVEIEATSPLTTDRPKRKGGKHCSILLE